MNKKALSSAVAAVTIILLVIAAVGILTPSVIRVANSPQFSPEFNCIDLQTTDAIKILSACHDQEANELKVSLSRSFGSPDLEIINFNLAFPSGEASSYQAGGPSCVHCLLPEEGESTTYFFTEKQKPSKVKLNALSCDIMEKEVISC